MKVGILSHILGRRKSGIDNYLCNTIEEMIKAGHAKDLYLFHHEKSDLKIYSKTNDIITPYPPYKFIKNLGVVKAIKNLDLDVFHLPFHWYSLISPFFLNSKVKKVITIHDIIPILLQKELNLPHVLKLWGPSLKLIKNRVDCIICDSEHTKIDCMNYLNIPEEKFKVIYLAAQENFKVIDDKSSIKSDLKHKYNIQDPFILYVGIVELRKNIPLLIKSFAKVKKKGIPHKLVFVGAKSQDLAVFYKLLDKLKLRNDAIFTGYVADEDMVKFYNLADIFILPSLYEGFGLPVIEAMACGCPVIASNSSSLPEVVGNAGVLIDPNDYRPWVDPIYEILTNDGFKQKLIKKGLKRSKTFSWEKTSKETWQVYEDVCNNYK